MSSSLAVMQSIFIYLNKCYSYYINHSYSLFCAYPFPHHSQSLAECHVTLLPSLPSCSSGLAIISFYFTHFHCQKALVVSKLQLKQQQDPFLNILPTAWMLALQGKFKIRHCRTTALTHEVPQRQLNRPQWEYSTNLWNWIQFPLNFCN